MASYNGRRDVPALGSARLSLRLGARPETAVRGSGGVVSASIRRRRAMGVTGGFVRTPHRRCDDAPAPATCVAPDRTPATAPPAGRRHASSTPAPPAAAGGRGGTPEAT